MTARVLCVDDEARVLDGLRLNLEMDFDVHTATSGREGLALMSETGFDVVVSDMRMPQMDGAEFLAEVRSRHPQTMRILLTGQADTESALRAVNGGGIFRYLQKPCPAEDLIRSIEDALEVQRARRLERELLSTTLKASVEVLTEVLAVACPVVASRANMVQTILSRLGPVMGVPADSQWEVEVAGLLSRLGSIALPDDVVERAAVGQKLPASEREMVARIPKIGADMIRRIPRLENAANLVADAESKLSPDGEGEIQRVLNVAMWISDHVGAGGSWDDARKRVAAHYGTTVAAALGSPPGGLGRGIRVVRGGDLRVGMTVQEDIHTKSGQLVVKAGTTISRALATRLHNFHQNIGLQSRIRVS